jgi:hypothetical protein
LFLFFNTFITLIHFFLFSLDFFFLD